MSVCWGSPAAKQGQCDASVSTTCVPFLGAHDADSERQVDGGKFGDQQTSAELSQWLQLSLAAVYIDIYGDCTQAVYCLCVCRGQDDHGRYIRLTRCRCASLGRTLRS